MSNVVLRKEVATGDHWLQKCAHGGPLELGIARAIECQELGLTPHYVAQILKILADDQQRAVMR